MLYLIRIKQKRTNGRPRRSKTPNSRTRIFFWCLFFARTSADVNNNGNTGDWTESTTNYKEKFEAKCGVNQHVFIGNAWIGTKDGTQGGSSDTPQGNCTSINVTEVFRRFCLEKKDVCSITLLKNALRERLGEPQQILLKAIEKPTLDVKYRCRKDKHPVSSVKDATSTYTVLTEANSRRDICLEWKLGIGITGIIVIVLVLTVLLLNGSVRNWLRNITGVTDHKKIDRVSSIRNSLRRGRVYSICDNGDATDADSSIKYGRQINHDSPLMSNEPASPATTMSNKENQNPSSGSDAFVICSDQRRSGVTEFTYASGLLDGKPMLPPKPKPVAATLLSQAVGHRPGMVPLRQTMQNPGRQSTALYVDEVVKRYKGSSRKGFAETCE